MEGHVFQGDIFFRITCHTGVYVSWEVMLCRRICLIGGDVMHQYMFSGWHILQEDVPYKRLCLTCGHLLLEDMFFMGTCPNPMHLVGIREYSCIHLFIFYSPP